MNKNIDKMTSEINCQCTVCQELKGHPEKTYKTTRICVMILKSLHSLKPQNEYFSLKPDIDDFIKSHWSLFSQLKQFQIPNWRKGIMDAFSHCTLIESGKSEGSQRGFYKLKVGGVDKRTLLKKERIKLQQQSNNNVNNLTNNSNNLNSNVNSNTPSEQSLSEIKIYQFERDSNFMTIGQELSICLESLQSQLTTTQVLLKKKYNNLLLNKQNQRNQIENQNNQTQQLELQFMLNQNEMHLNIFSQFTVPL